MIKEKINPGRVERRNHNHQGDQNRGCQKMQIIRVRAEEI